MSSEITPIRRQTSLDERECNIGSFKRRGTVVFGVVIDLQHVRTLSVRESGYPASGHKCYIRGSAWRTHKGAAMMNGCRESDNPIVSEKPSNKVCDNKQAAEKVERRGLAKGNPSLGNRVWTQRQRSPVQ